MQDFRQFEVGPDPYGRSWRVNFLWQQNAISIRHADTVDVKFTVDDGEQRDEKIIALPHPLLLEAAKRLGRPLNDAWCSKLAAAHLERMILSANDIEKPLVVLSAGDIELANRQIERDRATA